jgi:hypothetical protein
MFLEFSEIDNWSDLVAASELMTFCFLKRFCSDSDRPKQFPLRLWDDNLSRDQ